MRWGTMSRPEEAGEDVAVCGGEEPQDRALCPGAEWSLLLHLPASPSQPLLPDKQEPPSELGLTSGSSQVAVEGNVSLAHRQEVCTNVWKDKHAGC